MSRNRRSRTFKKPYTVELENNWVLHIESQEELDKVWYIVDQEGSCFGIMCFSCPFARPEDWDCTRYYADKDGYAFGGYGERAFVDAMAIRGFRK